MQPVNLHWFPISPTWIVSLCIVIVAALPHQIPLTFGLTTVWGTLLGISATILIGYYRPILGVAIALLIVSKHVSEYIEGFTQPITTNLVDKKHKWESELKIPDQIQEKTDTILVTDMNRDKHIWQSEDLMDDPIFGIQERVLPEQIFQETEYPQKLP